MECPFQAEEKYFEGASETDDNLVLAIGPEISFGFNIFGVVCCIFETPLKKLVERSDDKFLFVVLGFNLRLWLSMLNAHPEGLRGEPDSEEPSLQAACLLNLQEN